MAWAARRALLRFRRRHLDINHETPRVWVHEAERTASLDGELRTSGTEDELGRLRAEKARPLRAEEEQLEQESGAEACGEPGDLGLANALEYGGRATAQTTGRVPSA
ncbi:hypothetical protein ACFY3G_47760 [Streptomyces phaeochromogenes]|uniref:hypothetical protein n=1 Tax=Streptomyces phaeochromogenes TaxID=1923 RepID=UPI0036A8E020